ncbi:acyl carrier protein phosphodiesterase [Flavobacteriaceae bacterium]
MNFLAHIYLSGDSDLIKIGNFMADGVRGNKHLELHSEIQKGIILHRTIDTFTDAHPVFRQSTKRLHANYHHFSGVIVDVFYDHFLAKNWSLYSDEKLEDYVDNFYNSLHTNQDLLTEKAQMMKPYMIQQNWLLSYKTIDGIEKILSQMDSRIKRESNLRFSVQELRLFYKEFEDDFTTFFNDLRIHSSEKLLSL